MTVCCRRPHPTPVRRAAVTFSCSRRGRWFTLLFVLVPGILLIAGLAGQPAARGEGSAGLGYTDADQLCNLDQCGLEQLYGRAEAGTIPVGFGRGKVLLMVNTRLP